MQKKVIILTPFWLPHIGGAETFAVELARETRKRHATCVCTIYWDKLWKGINWKDSFWVIARLWVAALLTCTRIRPDTIHALGFNAAFVGVLLKPFFKFKLIVTPLSLYDFNNILLARVVRWTLQHADLVFAESELSKVNLSQVTGKGKIKVFTHWVDTTKFFSVKHPKYNKDKLRVLFAGRPLPEKGGHIIKQVEKEMPEVAFIFAENIANVLMPSYFQNADILVVPSMYAESPNRVVAEGAACGCVVMTSNRGALPEQVKAFGQPMEPTVACFNWAINRLNKNRKHLAYLRKNTIAYAARHLTEKNAEVIINEY